MGAIFWGAVEGLLLLTVSSALLLDDRQHSGQPARGHHQRHRLFIGMMGLKSINVIVANPETLVSIGNLTSHSVCCWGSRILYYCDSRFAQHSYAAVLVSIIVTTRCLAG